MKKAVILSMMSVWGLSALAQTGSIRINQVGFEPKAQKTATIESAADAPWAEAVLLCQKTGKEVWRGKAHRKATSAISGKVRQIVDFTPFSKKGDYLLVVGQEKMNVKICEHPFADLSRAAVKAFYYQRSGMPIEEAYAGRWARPAAHPDTAVAVHPSAATPHRPAGTLISSNGGWYDAGDYNKYIVNSAFSIGVMLGAYDRCERYFKRLDTNIPESSNGVPDLLDELHYNLKWMLTMQDQDGGVYHKLTTPNFEGFIPPAECRQQRYVVAKSTSATLDFAASMAMASRYYQKYEKAYPGFSSAALQQAEKAYAWAKSNPNVFYSQHVINGQYDPDVVTGEYGDRRFSDEFFWAATELYFATGNPAYREDALRHMPQAYTSASWGNVAELGMLEWLFMKPLADADRAVAAAIKGKLLAHLDTFLQQVETSCFQSPCGNAARDFYWGCNAESVAWRGAEMMYACLLTGNPAYREAALQCMNYLLGQNATGYCYVTGFGTKSPLHPHHRLAATSEGALPGFLAGGPNPGQQDKGENLTYDSHFADESYMDNQNSYASNEIAINWNAALVALAALLNSPLSN